MSESQNSDRRVVITGLGIVAPIGNSPDEFWDGLRSGQCGIDKVTYFSKTALPSDYAAEVKGFGEDTVKAVVPKKQRKFIRVMCREIQLGVTAAAQVVSACGLDSAEINHERLGVEFGANSMFSPPWVLKDGCYKCTDAEHHFHFERWGTDGLSGMEPLWLLKYLPNMPACHIGIIADARGPNNSLTQAEASGNLAIGEALRILRRDSADMMLAGSGGTRLNPVKTLHARLWNELAVPQNGPETLCRPFDARRNGQVAGEGACCFLLEEESHAKQRGAEILGTLLGAGSSCVANGSGKPDLRRALAQAMRAALDDAGVAPADIGHINAHGLAERVSDVEEAAAIHDVFGESAESVPVVALKGHLANSGAACGTLELAGSLLALRAGVLPATLNYETPDPDCRLNVVHGEPQPVTNKTFLNINVTLMGQASALVVRVA